MIGTTGMFPAFSHVSERQMDLSLKACASAERKRSRSDGPEASSGSYRTAIVFSEDPSVLGTIAAGLPGAWTIEPGQYLPDPRRYLIKPGVRIVVVDDQRIEETARGWLLDQIRKS